MLKCAEASELRPRRQGKKIYAWLRGAWLQAAYSTDIAKVGCLACFAREAAPLWSRVITTKERNEEVVGANFITMPHCFEKY